MSSEYWWTQLLTQYQDPLRYDTKTLKLSWILTLFLNVLKVPSARTCTGVALMACNIPLLNSAYPQKQFPKGLHFQLLTLIMSPLCLNLIIQTWWGRHLKDDTMATFKISPFPTSKSFKKNIPIHWVPVSFYCPLNRNSNFAFKPYSMSTNCKRRWDEWLDRPWSSKSL